MDGSSIVLRVENISTFIEGKLQSSIYKQFRKELGYMPENAQFQMRKRPNWDGIVSTVCFSKHYCKCHVKKDGTHFPSGLLSKAREFFDANAVDYSIVDNRLQVDKTLDLCMSPEFIVKDFQSEAIKLACQKGRGIIQAATGSGKTAIAAGIIAQLGVAPFVFYVPSIDLLKQAKDELSRFILQNGLNLKVGVIGDGICDIQDINIMTIQTAVRACNEKYESYDDEEENPDETKVEESEENKKKIYDLIRTAKGLMGDEVQHWSSKSCQVICDNSEQARYKFGLSATPKRDLGDDILIDACFGKCIYSISASFLIKHGYLIKPDIFFVKISNMDDSQYSSYQKLYQYAIVENDYRNNLIRDIAMTMFQNGRSILVLCKHIKHGQKLEELMPGSVFINGSHSAIERKTHLDQIREGKPGITIASSIFDEGIDCKPLNTLILAGSGKSATRALQRIGRIIRPFPPLKKDAIVVDFWDECKYMKNHSRKRKNIYKTEEEFDIKDFQI